MSSALRAVSTVGSVKYHTMLLHTLQWQALPSLLSVFILPGSRSASATFLSSKTPRQALGCFVRWCWRCCSCGGRALARALHDEVGLSCSSRDIQPILLPVCEAPAARQPLSIRMAWSISCTCDFLIPLHNNPVIHLDMY